MFDLDNCDFILDHTYALTRNGRPPFIWPCATSKQKDSKFTWPRIYRLSSLQRSKISSMNVLHMTLNNDGEAPVMLELWGMQSTPLLPSLPGLLWLGVVAPDMVLSMSQIELNSVLMLN